MKKVGIIILSIIAWIAILIFTGWDFVIGSSLFFQKSFILDETGILIKINSNFYGFMDMHRFFNSPVLAWIGFGFAFFVLIGGIKKAFEPKWEEEETEDVE